jgi:hypothetical protein
MYVFIGVSQRESHTMAACLTVARRTTVDSSGTGGDEWRDGKRQDASELRNSRSESRERAVEDTAMARQKNN